MKRIRPEKNILKRKLEKIDFKDWNDNWGFNRDKNPTPLQLRILQGRAISKAFDNDTEMAYKSAFDYLHLTSDDYACVRGNRRDIGGMEKAANRIIDAIANKEHIALACDFDVDGTSSAALLKEAFISHFGADEDRIHVFISHRLKEGYGFTNAVVDRIIASENIPTLVITADQGSSNKDSVAYYDSEIKNAGLTGDVIITDHHEIPEDGGAKNAYAFINPTDKDNNWHDPTICGAGVAYLLMEEVAHILNTEKGIKQDFDIERLLGYTAAATVADCVSLASPLNRYFFNRGIRQIDNGDRPAWRQMRTLNRDPATPIDNAESISFGLGPRINACSRMGMDGMLAVNFFTSKRDDDASDMLSELSVTNDGRKVLEREMERVAMGEAEKQYLEGKNTIVVYLPEGHHGIHGIVASRVVEAFGRPTIMISPKDKEAGTVSGSARSIAGFNLAEVLERIREDEGLLIGSGGHTMAAGMSLYEKDIEAFANSFEVHSKPILDGEDLRPKVYSDGSLLEMSELSLDTFDEIAQLEPYGINFEKPAFADRFTIKSISSMGDGTHFRLSLEDESGETHTAVWFKAIDKADDGLDIDIDDNVCVLYQLSANWWRGRSSLQLMINTIKKEDI